MEINVTLNWTEFQIERVIPVAGRSELTSFGHLFYSSTRRNLSDGHIWFSVFTRPVKSKFTRVQRATCCLSLLFCTMMANIVFYGQDMQDIGGNQVCTAGLWRLWRSCWRNGTFPRFLTFVDSGLQQIPLGPKPTYGLGFQAPLDRMVFFPNNDF